jgi:hypothetical protein
MKKYIKSDTNWESAYEDEVVNDKHEGDNLYEVVFYDDRGYGSYSVFVYAPNTDIALKQAVAYCDNYGDSTYLYAIDDLYEGFDDEDADDFAGFTFVDATEYGASQGYYVENISVKKVSDANFIASEIVETLYAEHPEIDFLGENDLDRAIALRFETNLSDDEFKDVVLSLFPQYADRLKFGQSHYKYAKEIRNPYIAIMK